MDPEKRNICICIGDKCRYRGEIVQINDINLEDCTTIIEFPDGELVNVDMADLIKSE